MGGVYSAAVEIRTLREGEREAVLELLDPWDVGDGWRGRDFFRRYVEDDPSYRDENFWVAEEDGRLLSCVQIFPRRLRAGDAVLPLGGIGSVYTRADARKGGVGTGLLRAAEDAMRARGLALGMLFAGPIPWYERLGWHSWPFARAIYTRADAAATRAPEIEIAAFDRARDLESLVAIHADYSGSRSCTVVRERDEDWEGSLRLTGNPGEDFRIALRSGEAVAYARLITLSGHPILAEFGRRADAADDLAALLAALFGEGGAFGAAPADAALEKALASEGVALHPLGDPNAMLRCLDAAALCEAAGLEPVAGESDAELLRRILPPERCLFWSADRF